MPIDLSSYNIIVVIPAYRVEREIGSVLKAIPAYIRSIIVVNDASPDNTSRVIDEAAKSDPRIFPIHHSVNQGVGGAMLTGYKKALELEAQVVVKLDGDGQMSPDDIPSLVLPLIQGKADFSKGNRFRDLKALNRMPIIRRVGNLALSFLVKLATGYWSCFDPTNGFLAIRGEILEKISFDQIDKRYFFEISQLSQLYLLGALTLDVPLSARYSDETSSLSIFKVLLEFPPSLLAAFVRRIMLHYFLYDFSIGSIYILAGIPLFLFGVIFGSIKWIYYAGRNTPAPTGTVMLSTLTVILGIQFLISAISIDLQSVPSEPLCGPL